jgi:hypothetical protein
MKFHSLLKTPFATPTRAHGASRRPRLERLEDRIVPSLADGTILVATGPSSFSSQDQSSFPIGIIGVDPNTGGQSRVSTGGMFSLPTYIAQGPNELYITDFAAFGTGAVIGVDPNTGQQTLVAKGGFLDGPNVLVFMNGYLYVANEGNASGTIHTIVQIDPNTGVQTLITDGSSGGFSIPVGMAVAPGNNLYVTDEPGNVQGSDPGKIWLVNVATGQQTVLSSNNSTQGSLFNHPVDMAVEASGNLTVVNTGTDGFLGTVIQVNAQTGVQSLVTTFIGSDNGGLDSIEAAQDGTLYVGAISYSSVPGRIYSVNPTTGAQNTISSGGNLSLVEGIRIFHPTGQTTVTATTVSSSADPSVFGQMVTLTATVSVQSPSAGTPTGTVQFQIDGSNVGSPVSVSTFGGLTTATFGIATLPVGLHTVTASYKGDSSFAGSTGFLLNGQGVNKASTTTAVVCSANPSTSGQTVTFTATVMVNTPGSTAVASPTGTVVFLDGGTGLGQGTLSTVGGVTTATFSTNSLTAGHHQLTALYNSGDTNFNSSPASAPIIQFVKKGQGGRGAAQIKSSLATLLMSPNQADNAGPVPAATAVAPVVATPLPQTLPSKPMPLSALGKDKASSPRSAIPGRVTLPTTAIDSFFASWGRGSPM